GRVIPCAVLIPLAEDLGVVTAIDTWVLRRATRDAGCWPEPLRLSVNLSPATLCLPDLQSTVRSALADARLPADRLLLEITESVALPDPAQARRNLLALAEDGVQIAIDDFGTGHANLSWLQ